MAAALALVAVTLLATPKIILAAPETSHCVCNITASYVCTTADLIANPQDSTATCENTVSADGTINANIVIDGGFYTNLTTVDLSNVKAVNGSLRLETNPNLKKLSLDMLTSVTDAMIVYDNAALLAVTVPVLVSVGKEVTVKSNENLTTVVFPSLKTVGEELTVELNEHVVNAQFMSLETVGKELTFRGTKVTQGRFSSLKTVGEHVVVEANDLLETLSFEFLEETKAYFAVQNMPNMTTLLLPKLKSSDSFVIRTCKKLTELSLPEFTKTGTTLALLEPATLEDPNVDNVGSGFAVAESDALVSLSAPKLSSVGSMFGVVLNKAMNKVDISSLTKVEQLFTIHANDDTNMRITASCDIGNGNEGVKLSLNSPLAVAFGVNVTGEVIQPCAPSPPPPLYANSEAPKANIDNDGLGWGLVGAGVGFWFLVAVAFIVYFRRQRQAREAAEEEEKKALHLQDAESLKNKKSSDGKSPGKGSTAAAYQV